MERKCSRQSSDEKKYPLPTNRETGVVLNFVWGQTIEDWLPWYRRARGDRGGNLFPGLPSPLSAIAWVIFLSFIYGTAKDIWRKGLCRSRRLPFWHNEEKWRRGESRANFSAWQRAIRYLSIKLLQRFKLPFPFDLPWKKVILSVFPICYGQNKIYAAFEDGQSGIKGALSQERRSQVRH